MLHYDVRIGGSFDERTNGSCEKRHGDMEPRRDEEMENAVPGGRGLVSLEHEEVCSEPMLWTWREA